MFPRIECRAVTKSFHHPVDCHVLRGIDLQVERGETVVITGKSGQGKSVLLSLLAGLDVPTSGEILIDGISQHALTTAERAKIRQTDIGIVFQNFNLIPVWTVTENVMAGLECLDLTQAQKQEKTVQILQGLGLLERLHHLPGALSMGEKQRVAIARALVRDPSILLADEPTGDVDTETAQTIVEMLHRTVVEQQVALVVASHGPFPLRIADHVYSLNNGMLSPLKRYNRVMNFA